MGPRLAELTGRFDAAAEGAIALVESVPDARWTDRTAAEGWTIAAVAHHIARAFLPEARLIRQVATGEPIMAAYRDWSLIHAANAEGKDRHAACTKAEVVDLVRANRTEALAIIGDLRDDQLDNAAVVPILGDEPRSAGWLIERLLIGHIEGHLASIRATLAAA